MSLLADLLSRLKYQNKKTDVPPALKRIVADLSKKEANRKKVIILSALVLLAIISGAGTIYLVELYIKPSAQKRIAEITPPAQIETRPALPDSPILPEVEPPEPQVPAIKPELPEIKPKAIKPKPVKEIPRQKKTSEPKIEEKKIAEEQRPEPKAKPEAEPEDRRYLSAVPAQAERIEDRRQMTEDRGQTKEQRMRGKDAYLFKARTYESKKDYHMALLNYKNALELDPQNHLIMNNIASMLINLGFFESAVDYLKKSLSIRNNHIPSLINLGIAYIKLGKLAEGEVYFTKVLSIEPGNNHALLNLGILYEIRRDYDMANSYFLRLAEMDNIEGYLGTARIAERQGRISDAVMLYREIISKTNINSAIKRLANDRLLQLGN